MDYNHPASFGAWMISGGPWSEDPAQERNRAHVRALKASRPARRGILSRVSAAIAAIRPAASTADADCSPA